MSATHLSSETLDRLAIGALSATDKQGAEAHLHDCTRCREDYQALEADMQQFRQFVMPRTQEKVRERVAHAKSPMAAFSRWMAPAFALAGAATMGLLIVAKPANRLPTRYEGVKGGPILQVYDLRAGGQKPEELKARATVAPGDRIRFIAEPSGYGYVMVVSVDGKGTVSSYYPSEGTVSAPLTPGRQELPGAIELDATPGTEHLYAYFSRAPLKLESIASQLKAHPEKPPVPAGAAPPVIYTLQKASP